MSVKVTRRDLWWASKGAAFALLAAMSVKLLPLAAVAAPRDYRFELVGSPVQSGNRTTITVRLVHIPTGRAVSDATIVQSRLEMRMGSMVHPAPLTAPAAADAQGNYRFTAELGMSGELLLTLAASVQGESELIRATLPVRTGR
jgi:hypothetical protein